jgi:hypothetical protein
MRGSAVFCNLHRYAVQPVRIFVKPVVAQFKTYIQEDEKAGGHANG